MTCRQDIAKSKEKNNVAVHEQDKVDADMKRVRLGHRNDSRTPRNKSYSLDYHWSSNPDPTVETTTEQYKEVVIKSTEKQRRTPTKLRVCPNPRFWIPYKPEDTILLQPSQFTEHHRVGYTVYGTLTSTWRLSIGSKTGYLQSFPMRMDLRFVVRLRGC